MLKAYIKSLTIGENLSFEQSLAAGKIIFGDADSAQVAAFLSLLSAKGVTSDELAGMLSFIRSQMTRVDINYPVVDIVGTGGDHSNSLNISTASALLLAACGVPVVKHGNRAASSRCGSADVLEILGYPINQSANDIEASVAATNFGFCFAPKFNPILGKVREVRKQLGIPTIFNLVGPLCNPADAQHLLLGVYDLAKVELVAKTLAYLGTTRSLVFSAYEMDELTCIGPIQALLIEGNQIKPFSIDYASLGLRQCKREDLIGGDALYNSQIIAQTLSGVDTKLTDNLILNVAAALFIYGRAVTLESGVAIARDRLIQGNILPKNRLHEIILRKTIGRQLTKTKSLKAAIMGKPSGGIIAEIKRSSPSAGKIATINDPVNRAQQYVSSGAVAISVLTDEGFEGSLADLRAVSDSLVNSNVPVLCKDFFVYPEQIAQAKDCGADAILIMVSVLHHDTAKMIRIAHDFGLETLVEVHSPDELTIALNAGGDVIGVNQRDLRDFSMHPQLFAQLSSLIPSDIVKIAESGMAMRNDVLNAYNLGYNAVLVGSALSKLDNVDDFFGNNKHVN